MGADHDRYKRTIAVCFKGDTNLNAWMVSQGWAVAFRKYGIDYIRQEDEARLARRGIWAGSFEMPWDLRARNKLAATRPTLDEIGRR